ncbi:MAG TPA: glycosyltransferase, partial [Acidimicrobiales bacterium]|nr:glycosyltransferase [Acidimicrobiales bacterium]
LCPSIRPEGLGMVALEAEAVGAPVVTSGLGGLADATFEPNETVGDGDPDAWCDAVERALARPASVLPAMAVRRAHGEEVAARSFLALVRQASGRGYSAHEHGVYSRP